MAPDSSQTPIAEVMAGEHVVHRTQEVLGRAREAPRAVSLATVYKTLNELVDMGEFLEIPTSTAASATTRTSRTTTWCA